MQTFTAKDGTALAFKDEGEGLPVIALAGLTRNSHDFDFVAPHLAGVRLIRPDYRGRGQSGWSGAASYTVLQEGEDVLALMDHLGIARAALLGTSRGGLISMGLAAAARDRVIGVCLNDIGPAVDTSGIGNILTYIGKNPAAKTYDEAAAARAKAAIGFSGVPAERWLADVKNLFNEVPGGLAINYDPALRDSFQAQLGDLPDLWPFFDALAGLPTALIHGAGSDILTDETVTEMRRRRPDMRYARVPGRGHAPWLDEPDALVVLRAWIEDCR